MEQLPNDVATKVVTPLQTSTLQPCDCPCKKEVALRVMKQTAISMSPNKVKVQCGITNDSGYHMKQTFQGTRWLRVNVQMR
jgi:hypothetical protein